MRQSANLSYRTGHFLNSLAAVFGRANNVWAREPETKRPEALLNLTFRLGFAGVFLINSLTAWIEPAAFSALLNREPTALLTRAVGLEPLLALIAVNDLVLGGLILTGRCKTYVLAWAGVWLLAVTVVKMVSLGV